MGTDQVNNRASLPILFLVTMVQVLQLRQLISSLKNQRMHQTIQPYRCPPSAGIVATHISARALLLSVIVEW
jgi:hypothetical protein